MAGDDANRLSITEAEALDWVRRIDDPTFSDWDGHLAWLDQDPEHAAAFDRLSLLVADAVAALPPGATASESGGNEHRCPTPGANDNAFFDGGRAGGRARWWIGGTVAVAAAALAVVTTTLDRGPADRVLQTGPGEHRTISLADGTTIAMNGGTRIRLTGPTAREVALESGEAFFSVRHDDARPFAVRIGDGVVRDVGTAFDVARTENGAIVAVREGEVAYEAARQSVRLPAGRRLVVYKGTAAVSSVDPSAVGGWRHGRLVYRDATLTDVAVDLSRAIGDSVVAGPDAPSARFTGVIVLDRDLGTTFSRVEAATGARAARTSDGWRLISPGR